MKKTTILAFLLWIGCVPLFGQTIKGTVVDHETSDPLYLANVVLLSLPDSTFVTGTVTDEAGYFSLPRVGKGACVIRVSYRNRHHCEMRDELVALARQAIEAARKEEEQPL